MRNRFDGHAIVEYTLVLVVLAASLWLPVAGGQSLVAQLESSLRLFWQGWRAMMLTAGLSL